MRALGVDASVDEAVADDIARDWVRYFGEPWPSGICDGGHQEPTPVGHPCGLCREVVVKGDQGSYTQVINRWGGRYEAPIHRECSLRSVLGGIGHLTDHARWCVTEHDPDAGLSYRESARQVWAWVRQ